MQYLQVVEHVVPVEQFDEPCDVLEVNVICSVNEVLDALYCACAIDLQIRALVSTSLSHCCSVLYWTVLHYIAQCTRTVLSDNPSDAKYSYWPAHMYTNSGGNDVYRREMFTFSSNHNCVYGSPAGSEEQKSWRSSEVRTRTSGLRWLRTRRLWTHGSTRAMDIFALVKHLFRHCTRITGGAEQRKNRRRRRRWAEQSTCTPSAVPWISIRRLRL